MEEVKAWVVSGSMYPASVTERQKGFTSGIDGYEVYLLVGEKKYRINNKELEQFKLEK